ncbi:uncharacterized protein LOC136062894 [Quercus suber]|uniref:uncharacterized protein LOC136062894 n=1 Tax=Quercus suber TaxID=58331 RepID=UPI0032DF60C7
MAVKKMNAAPAPKTPFLKVEQEKESPRIIPLPEAAKSIWDKAALTVVNANNKILNAIFCGVSLEEFHRISHITIAKEAWEILETTYEGTKKVKDTKLQMLTTCFEELRMSEDESFDSFYGKLNAVVVGKFNLGEKTEDSKIVRKILRSLPESFRAKKKSKSLALKTIDERVVSHESSEEDAVDKDVAYLVKNFRKFLKLKNGGKFGDKGKFQSSGKEKKEFQRKDSKDSQSSQGITCFECNGHGHFKMSQLFEVKRKDDLGSLLKELGEHFDLESIGVVEESEAKEDEDTFGLQENYALLLEKSGEYAKMAKAAVKKMKRAKEDYKSLLVRYKEAKCEIEALNGELSEAYTKSGLGYTGGSSSSANVTKEVKFVKAKEMAVDKPIPKNVKAERKKNAADQRVFNKSRNQSQARFGARGRSLPRSLQGPRMNYLCHYCGLQGHTRPNCHKLRALNNASAPRSRGRKND